MRGSSHGSAKAYQFLIKSGAALRANVTGSDGFAGTGILRTFLLNSNPIPI
jgi:hypothetical protein